MQVDTMQLRPVADAGGATLQEHTLQQDVAAVHAMYATLTTLTQNRLDHTRALGIVTAAAGAEAFFPYSIPLLLRQIARAERGADLIIGLNNGFDCPQVIHTWQHLPDTEVIHLYTADKLRPDLPAASFGTPAATGTPYVLPAHTNPARPHRIFVVHQKPGPHAAGKMRMLGDIIHGLVLPSMRQGWTPPAHMLLFDAESVFFTQEPSDLVATLQSIKQLYLQTPDDLGQVVAALTAMAQRQPPLARHAEPSALADLDGPGFDVLIREFERDPGVDLLGTTVRFCVYNRPAHEHGMPMLLPSFSEPIAPVQHIHNYLHGFMRGFMCLPGSGTAGRTHHLLSLIGMITQRYASLRPEDTMYTVLAEHAGFAARITHQVHGTNRCFRIDALLPDTNQPMWQVQQARWINCVNVIEQLYGRERVQSVLAEVPTARYMLLALAIFTIQLRETGDVQQCLAALDRLLHCQADYDAVQRLAAQQTIAAAGPHANPAW